METQDKKRVSIIWGYGIESNNDSWINSEDPEITISIDNPSPSDYLILYESKDISPRIYDYAIDHKEFYKKIFTHNLSICDDEKIFHIPPFTPNWIDKNSQAKIYEKSELVSMIASKKMMCEGHAYRNIIADNFPYADHLFGEGRNRINNKIDGLSKYMFSVAMENCSYDTYYTEKILDCFLTGTVPIYWGTDKIDTIFDSKGIIKFDSIKYNELSSDLYKSMLPYIEKNFKIAMDLKCHPNDMIDHIIKNI
jgi:hypothetical protein